MTLFIVIHTTLAELGTHTYTSWRSNLDFIQFKGILELLWRFINQCSLEFKSVSKLVTYIHLCNESRCKIRYPRISTHVARHQAGWANVTV